MKLTQIQETLIQQHLELVCHLNEQVNITRIQTIEEGKILHVEDSLAGVVEINSADDGVLVDMGSGAGYPGIPLAVATGRDTVLVESVAKKARVLQHMVDELGLSEQVQVFIGRAEELALQQPAAFSVVTARALSTLPSLLELASPLLKQGGRFVGYKSQHDDEERAQAQNMMGKVGMSFVERREFELSDGSPRSIVVYEKTTAPTVKLPRRPGMAQSRPYKG